MAITRCPHCKLPMTESEAVRETCPVCGGLLRSPSSQPSPVAKQLAPQGPSLVLYDGHCKFCTTSVNRLIGLARRGSLKPVDFQEPGVLDRFPGLTHDMCMKQMYLVTPAGARYGGFEAAVQALATRPVLGWIAYAYYLPGIRLMLDLIYGLIAAHRYRIMGKAVQAGDCDNGTCALHLRPVSRSAR